MSRVLVLVEGPTERAVIQQAFAEYFAVRGIYIYPRVVGKPGHKGGNRFESVKKELLDLLKQEQHSIVTTFFDYYGLSDEWPGREQSKKCRNISEKPQIIENSIKETVKQYLSDNFNPERFIPYIQMHELEALLFTSPEIMAQVFQSNILKDNFETIVRQCGSCEEINDNPTTAPSKRIISVFPRYKKGSSVNAHAPLIIKKIGVDSIREKCQHFNSWVETLIALGGVA